MKNKILCIGQSVLDVQIKGVDIQTLYASEARKAETVQLSVGGDATNQSIVLSRLGFGTKLISGVGDDAAGFFLKTAIESKGVDIKDLVVVKDEKSFISIIIIDKEGERSFIFSGIPASDQLSPNLDSLKEFKVVSLGSMFCSPIATPEGIKRIAKPAKENGLIVCADIIVMPNTCRLADVGDTLSYIDYVFPNEDEARMFTGKETIDEIADAFLEVGVEHVVIKQGKKGCFLKTKEERMEVPAYTVNAVDTTGAGDNFVSGFITALIDNKPLYDCCRFGCATAAVNIQELGANTGVKSKEQVIEFMRTHD